MICDNCNSDRGFFKMVGYLRCKMCKKGGKKLHKKLMLNKMKGGIE